MSGTIQVKRDPSFSGETIAPCPPIVVIPPVYINSAVVVLLVFSPKLYYLPCDLGPPGILCCAFGRLLHVL